MKTLFFIVVLITSYGGVSRCEETFECPVVCSSNVYQPVCLRGKSYANLCRLQHDICQGKISKELYKDVEACPGYEKNEETSGASVEAIDKNGVIFRQFIDPEDNLGNSN